MDTAQLAAVAGTRRVERSFAFLDLCGFTDFVDAHGDERAVAELQHLRRSVREVAPMFGVRVEKWLGDGCMVVGVENEPIVAAAVAIEERHRLHAELALRAGVATGPVLLIDGDDYVGRAVNLAARLCEHAGAGQVLAAPDGLDLPPWVRAENETSIVVKGFGGPVTAVAVAADPALMGAYRSPGVIVSLVGGLTRRLQGG